MQHDDFEPGFSMSDPADISNVCQECGASLADHDGQAYCPACAMKIALEPSESELMSPSIDITQSMVLGGDRRDASDFKFDRELVPGTQFGDYCIIRRLGRGGMGVVYEADHQPTSRRVALKVMGHSLEDRNARARFLREGRLAASINHPGCVYVYGTEEVGGRPTISMELVQGGTLGEYVKSNGPFSPKAAVDVILQIVDGLEAAYHVGVLHRDIKPNNCFVDSDGQVKVGDFGLSISTTGRGTPHDPSQTEITVEGGFLGTPAYASPEQLRGEPLDHRSDIYAIGVTLFNLVTGTVPFQAGNMVQLLARVLDTAAPSVRKLQPGIPLALESVIAKCLRKAPGERFASYAELRKALLPLSSRTPAPATLGTRFLAGALDYALLTIMLSPISIWLAFSQPVTLGNPMPGTSMVMLSLLGVSIQFSYFAIAEWKYGRTVGKWCLGLQVVTDVAKPALLQALGRAFLYIVVPVVPLFAIQMSEVELLSQPITTAKAAIVTLVGWSQFLIMGAMFLTARARNGYMAAHDWITGTHVVCQLAVRTIDPYVLDSDAFDAKSGTQQIGPYYVLQNLGATDQGDLVLGYDAKLLRRVWIHRRPVQESRDASTPDEKREQREVSGKARLRWLGGHADSEQAWDCYEAISGHALFDEESPIEDWQVAATALRDLSDELRQAAKAGTVPRQLATDNLWVSDNGQVKILPFRSPNVFPAEAIAGLQVEAPAKDDQQKRLELLKTTAAGFLKLFSPISRGPNAISLTDVNHLANVARAENLEDAETAIAAIGRRPAMRVGYRVAGMIAASLVLPLFTVLSMLLMSLIYERQEAAMPEVRELAEALKVYELESRLSDPNTAQRLTAIDDHIRATFANLWDNKARMNSLYAQMQILGQQKQLDAIFSGPLPSPDVAALAEDAYLRMRAQHGEIRPIASTPFEAHYAILWATAIWIECTWLPSLVTAILFRGGILLHIFGLRVVNRRAQPAARLRVFLRMLLTGLLPTTAIAAFLSLGANYPNNFSFETIARLTAVSLVLTLCFVVINYRSRRRFFSDWCAGTYLVAA